MTRPEPYAPKRPSMSKKRRAMIFAAHGGICWLCKGKIGEDEPYDIDHMVAREISRDDSDDNLAPAHKECHREKSKADVKAIAKSNRIRRNLNPETRRVPRRKIPNRRQPWASRPFPKRNS